MSENLILLDIDHTVITKYINIMGLKNLQKIIQNLQQSSRFDVGLCSDRPYGELKIFQNILGTNGPLIGEMGGTFNGIPTWPNEYLLQIIQAQIELGPALIGFARVSPCQLTFGYNSVDYDKNLNNLTGPDSVYSGDHIYMDISRKCCLAVGFRSIHNGKREDTKHMVDECKKIIQAIAIKHGLTPENTFMFSDDNDWGVILVHFAEAGKYRVTPRLLKDYAEIFMIGDTTFDDLKGDERVVQMAVGNAETSYKDICSFVANYEYGFGVSECLLQIQKLTS